jgi:hypothetical protein
MSTQQNLVPQGIPSDQTTVTYEGTVFQAANTKDRPYYVFATRNGRIIWEINNKRIINSPLNNGGVGKLVIQDVQEGDLDSGKPDYQEMKQYIGKPALFIYYSEDAAVNRMTSWQIVDLNTGKPIAFDGVN